MGIGCETWGLVGLDWIGAHLCLAQISQQEVFLIVREGWLYFAYLTHARYWDKFRKGASFLNGLLGIDLTRMIKDKTKVGRFGTNDDHVGVLKYCWS